MKNGLLAFCAIPATALFIGCAGMINGKTQMINVDSNVKGAKVTFVKGDGSSIELGETPFIGPVPRGKGGAKLVIRKDGYAEKQQIVETKMSMVFLLNFLIPSGTFSSTTDITNETMWEYAPSNYYINLDAATGSVDFKKDTEIKRFVMMNYQQVADDLARADGKYLNALVYEIFKTESDKAPAVISDLQAILRAEGNGVINFGTKVADYYFSKLKA